MRKRARLLNILLSVLFPVWVVCPYATGEEGGPDVVVVAEAENPQPETLPTIRVVKEKLWGKYYPMVSMTFPNVPGFQCDAWCYESAVDFLDARAIAEGAVEVRHRDQNNPQALILTTITPKPGAVHIEARLALDRDGYPDSTLPGTPPGLNLCWQLRHAPGFASAPDPYPEFIRRCFIFTDRGPTFLLDTERTKIPVQKPEHEYNNPPWVQMYVKSSRAIPVTPPNSWAGYSPDRYLTPVIGAVSRDGRYLAALANDSADTMCQAWHDCMHNNPKWLPEKVPMEEQRWRLAIYAMENDPKALLEKVAQDFPKERRPVASAVVPTAPDGWKPVATRAGWIQVEKRVRWMKSLPLGPFVRLPDGGVLGLSDTETLVSRDEGVTWESHPLFGPDRKLEASGERALLRTKSGTIILLFLNMAEAVWGWDAERSLPKPGTRLPVWSIRGTDDGQTWTDAQIIYEGYSGDIHHFIQTRNGRVVAPVQELMYEDGRHAIRARYSDDEGKTWRRSNLLDIGGRGHHDGLIEPTIAQLPDGRLWMLCRTNLGRFWSAFSDNDGEDWRILQPSDIPASSAPGTFTRLASGRLMLTWNRPLPEGATEVPAEAMEGGDRQWSDERVSNFRAELSVALSSDDGKTWSKPVVVARRPDSPGASFAYSYVFEREPGELWLTTIQGDLRLAFREKDLPEE
ncbi:MAG TPA: sialidase family protein [bacterium]|nr:sialidase family protein [bacterium]HQL62266.1 sialidase family protein [bacterium]